MTARMFGSLRRFGGPLAESDAIAVIARRSPPLTRDTLRRYRELGVECVHAKPHPRYAWYHFMNKPVALLAAEESTNRDTLVFLDADTLVLRPPLGLVPPRAVDVLGCPSDDGVVGSTGPGDPNDEHWRYIAAVNGVGLDQLPWVYPYAGGPPIRFYLNGGVIGYRRHSGFSARYMAACERALDARAGFPDDGEHWLEQVCFGVAIIAGGLPWRFLPHSHNYAMASYLSERYSPSDFGAACIVHYHDSMSPAFWPTFLDRVASDQPQAYDWLRSLGPLQTETPLPWRLAAELLRIRRGASRRRYRRQVRLRR
jgi:hypothetical protein